ncbi:hypothetical protein ATX42_08710 [Oenococcus oeni]|nr:hypothetical protein ATX42_08710 [Oenococcus oeni]
MYKPSKGESNRLIPVSLKRKIKKYYNGKALQKQLKRLNQGNQSLRLLPMPELFFPLKFINLT